MSPKNLFLFDAIGALVSAFLLAIVLVAYQPVFGIPIHILYILSVFPCLFAIYDGMCIVTNPKRIGVYLKVIAFMNIGYVILSLVLAFCYYSSLTFFGWMYIFVEGMIVTLLAIVEFKVGLKSENQID